MDMRLSWMFLLTITTVGCVVTTTTQVVEMERVDQEIGGNRGYLMGSAPAREPSARKTTREVIQVDVELPTMAEIQQSKRRTSDSEVAGNKGYLEGGERAAEVTLEEVEQEEVEHSAAPTFSAINEVEEIRESAKEEEKIEDLLVEYKVQKGDTLQTIAGNPKVYGDSNQWVRIYEANRDQLKSPDKIYPGQTLRIPRE